MAILPTFVERRDYKLARVIDSLRDAFSHLEDVESMMVARGGQQEMIRAFSKKVAAILTGQAEDEGLAHLAARVKGHTF